VAYLTANRSEGIYFLSFYRATNLGLYSLQVSQAEKYTVHTNFSLLIIL